MTTINTLNRHEAKSNPERDFDTPEQIATEFGLTRAEKIKALHAWRFDIERRQQAADDGMIVDPDAARSFSDDAELLRQIGVQLERLEPGIRC